MGTLPPPTALPVTLPVLPRASGIHVPAPPSSAALLGPPPVAAAAPPPAVPQVTHMVQPGAAPAILQGGLSMGESRAPLPGKLVQKNCELRYIEMSELLPDRESWLLEDGAGSPSSLQFRRRKGPVTDILQWVQCYATLTSMLAMQYPQKVPELMAYLATIVKCHTEFEGPAWVLYDRAFQRQAEVSRDLNWSRVNPSLFNLCFTGSYYTATLSALHRAEVCPDGACAVQLSPPAASGFSCWPGTSRSAPPATSPALRGGSAFRGLSAD